MKQLLHKLLGLLGYVLGALLIVCAAPVMLLYALHFTALRVTRNIYDSNSLPAKPQG